MKQQQMISMLTRALEGGIQVVGASMLIVGIIVYLIFRKINERKKFYKPPTSKEQQEQ